LVIASFCASCTEVAPDVRDAAASDAATGQETDVAIDSSDDASSTDVTIDAATETDDGAVDAPDAQAATGRDGSLDIIDGSLIDGDANDSGLRCDPNPPSQWGTCDPTNDPACLEQPCEVGYDAYLASFAGTCSFMETFEYDCNLLLVHSFIRECLFDATTRKLVGSRQWSDTHNKCAGITVAPSCAMKSCRRFCGSTSSWDELRCPADAGSPDVDDAQNDRLEAGSEAPDVSPE
jgi:hypothetical protein